MNTAQREGVRYRLHQIMEKQTSIAQKKQGLGLDVGLDVDGRISGLSNWSPISGPGRGPAHSVLGRLIKNVFTNLKKLTKMLQNGVWWSSMLGIPPVITARFRHTKVEDVVSLRGGY